MNCTCCNKLCNDHDTDGLYCVYCSADTSNQYSRDCIKADGSITPLELDPNNSNSSLPSNGGVHSMMITDRILIILIDVLTGSKRILVNYEECSLMHEFTLHVDGSIECRAFDWLHSQDITKIKSNDVHELGCVRLDGTDITFHYTQQILEIPNILTINERDIPLYVIPATTHVVCVTKDPIMMSAWLMYLQVIEDAKNSSVGFLKWLCCF